MHLDDLDSIDPFDCGCWRIGLATVERDTLAFHVSCFGGSCPLVVVCVVFLSMYYRRLFWCSK
jgi:hypothetical protein